MTFDKFADFDGDIGCRRAIGIEAGERDGEIAAKRLAQGVLDFG